MLLIVVFFFATLTQATTTTTKAMPISFNGYISSIPIYAVVLIAMAVICIFLALVSVCLMMSKRTATMEDTEKLAPTRKNFPSIAASVRNNNNSNNNIVESVQDITSMGGIDVNLHTIMTATTTFADQTWMNTHMPLAIPGYLELKYDDFKITGKLAEGGAGLVYNASLRELC